MVLSTNVSLIQNGVKKDRSKVTPHCCIVLSGKVRRDFWQSAICWIQDGEGVEDQPDAHLNDESDDSEGGEYETDDDLNDFA